MSDIPQNGFMGSPSSTPAAANNSNNQHGRTASPSNSPVNPSSPSISDIADLLDGFALITPVGFGRAVITPLSHLPLIPAESLGIAWNQVLPDHDELSTQMIDLQLGHENNNTLHGPVLVHVLNSPSLQAADETTLTEDETEHSGGGGAYIRTWRGIQLHWNFTNADMQVIHNAAGKSSARVVTIEQIAAFNLSVQMTADDNEKLAQALKRIKRERDSHKRGYLRRRSRLEEAEDEEEEEEVGEDENQQQENIPPTVKATGAGDDGNEDGDVEMQ